MIQNGGLANAPQNIGTVPWNSSAIFASTSCAGSTLIAPPNQPSYSNGLIVNQPMMTDGIASSTSGTVITHGDSFGACASTPWWWSCGSCEPCTTLKRSLPWKVMYSSRKLYSAVTNTPSSTHQYA